MFLSKVIIQALVSMLRNIEEVIKGVIPNSIRLPLFDAKIYLMKNNGSDDEITGEP
jgi:hypothetical protein